MSRMLNKDFRPVVSHLMENIRHFEPHKYRQLLSSVCAFQQFTNLQRKKMFVICRNSSMYENSFCQNQLHLDVRISKNNVTQVILWY
jgi:hypothetical protein